MIGGRKTLKFLLLLPMAVSLWGCGIQGEVVDERGGSSSMASVSADLNTDQTCAVDAWGGLADTVLMPVSADGKCEEPDLDNDVYSSARSLCQTQLRGRFYFNYDETYSDGCTFRPICCQIETSQAYSR